MPTFVPVIKGGCCAVIADGYNLDNIVAVSKSLIGFISLNKLQNREKELSTLTVLCRVSSTKNPSLQNVRIVIQHFATIASDEAAQSWSDVMLTMIDNELEKECNL